MDDVEIIDVDDNSHPHPPLKNKDLSYLSFSAGEFLSQYGWFLLAATFAVYLLVQQLRRRRSSQGSQEAPTHTLQDASLVAKRQEAMEAARRKMQEELDAKAAIFKEKQKKQEEEKRLQKIEIWENIQQGKSTKLNANVSQSTEEASASSAVLKPKKDKKPLRSTDYSPLMGPGGSSCSWRPGRRGPSSGG